MLSINKVYKYLVPLIYISFAFDSLLKVNIGVKIHLGILVILFLNIIYFVIKGFREKIAVNRIDLWFFIFSVYAFFSGISRVGPSSLFIFFYLFLAYNVYFFVKKNIHYLTYKTFYYFQILMILTGLIQFLLVLFFDYQLNFLDIDHYSKGSSVTMRLRGFFVEPNWFAIAFTFNTFLLIKNELSYFIRKNYILFFFTFIVLIINGSFGTLAVLVITYGYQYFKRNIVLGLFLSFIGAVGFYLIIQKRAEFKKNKSGIELFNYYSRTEPFKRVNAYFETETFSERLLGEGLGSWGTLAVRNRLSVLNYEEKKFIRDSSELHVFLFELGLLGTMIFLLDILMLYRLNLKHNFYIKGLISLFVISFLLYPIFKFLMYMIYYFVMRVLISNNRMNFLRK